MADFKDFLSTDGYLARLARLNEIKTALAQWLSVGSHSNVPEGAIRWSQSQKRWEVYSGGTWGALETEYNVKLMQGAEPNTAVSNNSIVKRTGTGQVKAANPSANDEVTTRAFSDSRYVRQADLGESGGLTVENAAKLGGQLPAYYRNANNINAGTLPLARGGTGAASAAAARSSLGIDKAFVDGLGINASTLDGSDKAYYRNASNLNAGTVNAARLPSHSDAVWEAGTNTTRAAPTPAQVRKAVEALGAFGEGYELVDVTAARSLGTAYHNATNHPIFLGFRFDNASGANTVLEISDDGENWLPVINLGGSNTHIGKTGSAIIPADWHYKFTGSMSKTFITEVRHV